MKHVLVKTALASALGTLGLLFATGAAGTNSERHAFTAELRSDKAMTTQPVEFDLSAQHVGTGWSKSTSTFTAPVSGYYQFNLTASLTTDASPPCFFDMAVDVAGSKYVLDRPATYSTNVHDGAAFAWRKSGLDLHESGAAMIKVLRGQQVRVRIGTGNFSCRKRTKIKVGTIFSGHLVTAF